MKLKFLAFQIAAAALIAPAAVSFASTAPAPKAQPKPVPTVAAPAKAVPTPVATVSAETPATCGGPKVRVVYAGYVPPAPKAC